MEQDAHIVTINDIQPMKSFKLPITIAMVVLISAMCNKSLPQKNTVGKGRMVLKIGPYEKDGYTFGSFATGKEDCYAVVDGPEKRIVRWAQYEPSGFVLEDLLPGKYSITVKYMELDSAKHIAKEIEVIAGHTSYVSVPIDHKKLLTMKKYSKGLNTVQDTVLVKAKTYVLVDSLTNRSGSINGILKDTVNGPTTMNKSKLDKIQEVPVYELKNGGLTEKTSSVTASRRIIVIGDQHQEDFRSTVWTDENGYYQTDALPVGFYDVKTQMDYKYNATVFSVFVGPKQKVSLDLDTNIYLCSLVYDAQIMQEVFNCTDYFNFLGEYHLSEP